MHISPGYDDENIRRQADREKLKLMGSEDSIDDLELFQDNSQYLRALGIVGRELIEKGNYLMSRPTREGFDSFSQDIRNRMESLENLRKKSEETIGEPFTSTQVLGDIELSPQEETVVKLLYSARSVGIDTLEPAVKGEVLIALLNVLHGTPIEEGRILLGENSPLCEKNMIDHRNPRSKDRFIPRGRRRSYGGQSTEGTYFEISETVVDMMLGAAVLDEEDMETRRRGRHRRPDRGSEQVRKAELSFSMEDVVLKDSVRREIQGLMTQIKEKDKLYREWNLKKIAGTGINILFAGPSGTGKTLTAKALGKELGMEVYIVEFNQLINCYYGETEKNVESLFDVVEKEDVILLVDEADGILAHRGTRGSCVDSTENRIVNIFLQKMEEHSGVMILTSNLARGMDKALERRMALKVMFPKPEADARERIWNIHIPEEMPLADEVDLKALAKDYEFTGGQIRNTVLNAARQALALGKEEVTHSDFIHACKTECEGGKTMDYTIEDDDKSRPDGYL